jgi:hypothetical protein
MADTEDYNVFICVTHDFSFCYNTIHILVILKRPHIKVRSWGSSVNIVSHYRLDDRGSIPERGFFPLASVSIPALRSSQSPIQWVPRVLSRGKAWLGRDADHSSHLVPRSRMSRSYEYTCSPLCRLHCGSGTALLLPYMLKLSMGQQKYRSTH